MTGNCENLMKIINPHMPEAQGPTKQNKQQKNHTKNITSRFLKTSNSQKILKADRKTKPRYLQRNNCNKTRAFRVTPRKSRTASLKLLDKNAANLQVGKDTSKSILFKMNMRRRLFHIKKR